MMADVELQLLKQFEDTPEYKSVVRRIRELESAVKNRVDEDSWELIMKWEELWAQLLVAQQRTLLAAPVVLEGLS
ncbi:hypothetical protein CBW65_10015 [Tumebacillus avium]|uniref:Uncharacterized protein n=1 Tax=Tumebacillus avium TaxID=1903704 RepID=A0A1Y0ILC2_9BACL|nr:hypothetical protein [Tumebacillus avium]ARU61292.1 hypothetical protein CBW65_10015 [Tumebacillus avium]